MRRSWTPQKGVIGSRAMAQLRRCLSCYGRLAPVPASGVSVNCAGIAGAAQIGGIYDIPIGVAKLRPMASLGDEMRQVGRATRDLHALRDHCQL